MDQLSIKICSSELWYLLNLYAPTSVIGIENPYTGVLLDDIKKSEQAALQSLLSRQILQITDKKLLEFSDLTVKSMIETCLRPNRCLWMTASQGLQQKRVPQRLVYFSDAQILDVSRNGEQAYLLTVIKKPESLKRIITTFYSSKHEDKSASSTFVLDQTVLDAAIKAFDSDDEKTGKQVLSATELNDASIEELRSALGEKGRSLFAILVNNPTQPDLCHMQGFGYLSGRAGGWLLQQYEQNGSEHIRFQPGTVKEFREQILSQVL